MGSGALAWDGESARAGPVRWGGWSSDSPEPGPQPTLAGYTRRSWGRRTGASGAEL
jgi:hypothetical protein